MDKLEEVRKQIGKEFKVNPHELHYFTDGKARMTYQEKDDVAAPWAVSDPSRIANLSR